jgi:carbamoyl-phosphate synthase large subunit
MTAAVSRGIPCLTTVQALAAAVQGIEALRSGEIGVAPLQRHHELIVASRAGEAAARSEAAAGRYGGSGSDDGGSA